MLLTDSDRTRLGDNVGAVRERIADACCRAGRPAKAVTLVAVTKYVTDEVVRHLVGLGVRDFGESRPQSIWRRAIAYPAAVRWHLIGTLQTNKVRRTLPLAAMIHAIDRRDLADVVSAEALRIGKRVPAFLEVNVTGEASKHGFSEAEAAQQFAAIARLPGLNLVGLMGMAAFDDDSEAARPEFRRLAALARQCGVNRSATAAESMADLQTAADSGSDTESGAAVLQLSMGMSGDFEVAVEEGATHVRVGTALFDGVPAAMMETE